MEATLHATSHAPPISNMGVRVGQVMSGLAVLFLLVDSVMKFLQPAPVVDAFAQLGYPRNLSIPIGIILLIPTILYVIPATSFPGAILLTGYLGGAVASQLRIGEPLFSNVLFPIYVAAFLWGGLVLRDARVRALFLPKKEAKI